jgi:hypothetical protein
LKNDNLHIDPLKQQYPEPDIDVKTAWKEMNRQLDINGFPAHKFSFDYLVKSKSAQLAGLLTTAAFIVGVIFLYTNHRNNYSTPNPSIERKKEVVKTFSRKTTTEATNQLVTENHTLSTPVDNKPISLDHSNIASTIKSGKHTNHASVSENKVQIANATDRVNYTTFSADTSKNANATKDTTLKPGKTNMAGLVQHIQSTNTPDSISKQNCANELTLKERNKFLKKISKFIWTNMHGGLQWNVPLPQYGFENFYSTLIANKQLPKMLIPEIYVTANLTPSSRLSLKLNPNFQQLTGSGLISTIQPIQSNADSSSFDIATIKLQKNSSIACGLEYSYILDHNWIIGAGISYNINRREFRSYKTTNTITGSDISENFKDMSTDSLSKSIVRKQTWIPSLSLGYRVGKMEIGSALYIPLGVSNYISPRINAQLFIRYTIF